MFSLLLGAAALGATADGSDGSCDGIAFLQHSVARTPRHANASQQLLEILRGPMAELSSIDVNGRRCFGCDAPGGHGYLQRSDCGAQNVFDHPENLDKPLRSFSRAAGPGQNASNAYCELNYGKTCADAIFNEDYLMFTKALNLSKSTAGYDLQVCPEIRAVQHDFAQLTSKAQEFCSAPERQKDRWGWERLGAGPGRRVHDVGRVPRAVSAPAALASRRLGVAAGRPVAGQLGALADPWGSWGWDGCPGKPVPWALQPATWPTEGSFGLREECDGWDAVKGMPVKQRVS
eukprot:Skav210722  [mRNA]  locus=scaffold849:168489:172155:+ [translate_table: standard]